MLDRAAMLRHRTPWLLNRTTFTTPTITTPTSTVAG